MWPRAFAVAIALAVLAVVAVFGASPSAAHDQVIGGKLDVTAIFNVPVGAAG